MTGSLIDINILPLETLGEMANESGEQIEKNAKATVQHAINCGRYLAAVKDQLEHGEFGKWLAVNWNYSQPKAHRYMTIASNYSRVNNLASAGSISAALRLIADENAEKEPAIAPRSERKTGQVEVIKPGQPSVQAEEPDDDPTPDPPSIRKTAKGSQKVKEADKPKTQTVVPEILPAEPEEKNPLAAFSESEILTFLETTADEPKPRAKRLRKVADKLDPPTKFVKPDLEDVTAYFADQKASDAESFFDFYESKGWLVGKVSMKDWRASARKWIRENAHNGKANGNGHAGKRTDGSCLGPNGRPKIEPRKINYK